jgi:type III restriction enzyme
VTLAYNPGLVETIASTLRLRKPNADALDKIAEHLEAADPLRPLVADLATGVGKTYVAAGLVEYLYGAGVRNIVIITPGTTIQRKTIANFTAGTPKTVPGLSSQPAVLTVSSFTDGSAVTAIDDPDRLKLFVLTVQSLLKPNTLDARRAHRPNETVGISLSEYLTKAEDLVVIADEHHTYAGNAKQFAKAIADLEPQALIGLTATPDPSTNRADIIYAYPLADAIADGYVKVPVLVARPDGLSDIRTQLADSVALLDAKGAALSSYTTRTGHDAIQPVLFVVCGTISEANNVAGILEHPDLLGLGAVLVVTSEEPDASLEALDALEEVGSPYRAVVSVSMLREGWDVKSIYVICSTRAMDSELLTEQVLGRGLRLPFGRRTGISMLDTVEVVSHRKFAELLASAEVLLTQTLADRTGDTVAVPQSDLAGVPGDPLSIADLANAAGDATIAITLPGAAAADIDTDDPDQYALFVDDTPVRPATHEVGVFATLDARLGAATQTTNALNTTLVPRTDLGVRLPLFIPHVSVRLERDPFSLTRVDTTNVEALGHAFANDNAPTLVRVALEAERAEDGVHVVPTDQTAEGRVFASQEALPFDSIETDLAERLLRSNGVAQTASEHNAAIAIAKAFLAGAGVTKDTPWRPEHGRLATEALVRFVDRAQTSSPIREVTDVTQAKWPEPPEVIDGVPATNRNLVTKAAQFVRGHPYFGWTKSFYPVVRFDSFSAEFALARLLDHSEDVRAWTRVMPDVPLRIAYKTGAVTRSYVPDFLVLDAQGVTWVVEGKADSEMTDPVVLAKADAAGEWTRAVNASPVIASQWAYVLLSETTVKAATDWRQLLAAGRITR